MTTPGDGIPMLVLKRKLGEKVFVGEAIGVTVVDIAPGYVRLGIQAPRGVPIHRQELIPLGRPAGPPHPCA